MKVVIIGGVAGGASAAARLRRLCGDAEIIILEKGDYVSYANCGLPYYIGGEITEKSALTVQTPESLRARLDLEVRTGHQAVAIHPKEKQVEVRAADGGSYRESYDELILSPGAEPLRPPFPGVDDERVFTLRTIPDTYRIAEFIKTKKPKRALVVGGGFIGLEMVESLTRAGLQVTVAELADHLIGPLDVEMAADVHHYLRSQGVDLLLENGVQSISQAGDGLRVKLDAGEVETDMVLLSIGVRPDTALARAAGLELDGRGAIVVDEHLRSSAPHIYALGDAVTVANTVSGKPAYIPLAGPANKQGRLVADNIAGKPRTYKGSQGSAILKLFELAVGATGLNERAAAEAGLDYDKVYVMGASHAGYYPGARPISLKVLYEKGSGRILGAQLVGFEGVDKRLDVLALAVRHRMTADDLAEFEHGYAPPFSSAKDPVNMAGFVIQNLMDGLIRQFYWDQIPEIVQKGGQLVDVRSAAEYAAGHMEGAVNIPAEQLRQRLGQLDKGRPVYLCCQSGQRSYLAARALGTAGFQVSHLAGGYRLYASVALNHSPQFGCVHCG